jgi:hypothetical protein
VKSRKKNRHEQQKKPHVQRQQRQRQRRQRLAQQQQHLARLGPAPCPLAAAAPRHQAGAPLQWRQWVSRWGVLAAAMWWLSSPLGQLGLMICLQL